MSLIECPECKRKVSNNAEICPNCGYKLKANNYKNQTARRMYILNIIFCIFLLIFGLFVAFRVYYSTESVETYLMITLFIFFMFSGLFMLFYNKKNIKPYINGDKGVLNKDAIKTAVVLLIAGTIFVFLAFSVLLTKSDRLTTIIGLCSGLIGILFICYAIYREKQTY